MIHRVHSLSMTPRLREISPALTGDFPYLALEADMSRFPDGYSPWHWHGSFELCTVERGRMELSTPLFRCTLRAGEGYFVNANVLHCNRMLGSEPALLHVHQFDAPLLGGGELAARRYVEPIERCGALEALPLSRDDARGLDALSALEAAFDEAAAEDAGWELAVAARLTRAWIALGALAEPLPGGEGVPRDEARKLKDILGYLHAHFAEPISVADIALAAHVSERECYRCFRQTLDTSPVAYLNRLRVDAAARLLHATDHSVTEIAGECGFASPSYFCTVFREFLGRSPRDYRRSPDGVAP